MSKLVFIDSSVYLNCALKQVDKLSLEILDEFLSKIKDRKMLLLLPEIIKSEVSYEVKFGFEQIKQELCGSNGYFATIKSKYDNLKKNNPKKSEIIGSIIDEAKKMATEKTEKEYRCAIEIIEKIFNHRNVKIIKMTNKLILAGMKRSLLKLAPASGKGGHYTKDQDCITFESILQYLRSNKKFKKSHLIICADDEDYFIGNTYQLKSDIKKDLQGFCDLIVGYKNPLQMLNKEFKDNYTDKQIQTYDNIAKLPSSLPLSLDLLTSLHPSLKSGGILSNLSEGILSNWAKIPTKTEGILSIEDMSQKCPKCNIPVIYGTNWCHNCGVSAESYFNHTKSKF